MHELNAQELSRHTWERNLILIRIDARAQHGALQSPRPVSVQGLGVVQQHYLLTRGKTAGLQTEQQCEEGVLLPFLLLPPASVCPVLRSHQPTESPGSLTSVRQLCLTDRPHQ